MSKVSRGETSELTAAWMHGAVQKLGSCGETNEKTAALAHGVIAGIYSLLFIVEGIMIAWHVNSVRKHLQRSLEGVH